MLNRLKKPKFPKNKIPIVPFVLLASLLNLLFFHWGFFHFVFENADYKSFSGILLIVSLVVLMLVANAFVFYLFVFLFRAVGRFLLALTFVLSALSVYFVNTYGVIVDESMMGNVFNTNRAEASGFFSFKLVLYVLFLGIVPVAFIAYAKIKRDTAKRFSVTTLLALAFLLLMVFANAPNWLWIDKHAKQLGGLAMPWSYLVNASRHYVHQAQRNKKEIRLPDAVLRDSGKSVVVLVIGESARKRNFSLYGYEKNTNPLLSKTENVHHFDAVSCATYTTAGVKCMLEHAETNDLYEILPNYLDRNGVEVVWRTANWGEPPVHIEKYQRTEDLAKDCQGEGCAYDEILLAGLREQILGSEKDKILVILHTSTSHGPEYSKKYPPRFGVFAPVCNSVELAKCSREELVNAYDNTIVYTDHILHRVIENLKTLDGHNSAMLFVSDHGESLGEKNLYMHGVPIGFAPREQYEIPFIVWTSERSKGLKPLETLSQHHVFHSVLNFLGVESEVYDERMNVFAPLGDSP